MILIKYEKNTKKIRKNTKKYEKNTIVFFFWKYDRIFFVFFKKWSYFPGQDETNEQSVTFELIHKKIDLNGW